MITLLGFYLALVAVAAFSERTVVKLGVPHAAFLVLLGFAASEVFTAFGGDTGLRWQTFHDLVFFVFLPVLIFEAAYNIDGRQLLRNLPTILYLAIPLMLVATGVTLVSLVLAVTAAYALARGEFRGRGLLLTALLAVSMFPQVAVLSGMFELIRALGLYNHLGGLVLSYFLFTLPFTVWVLTAFLQGLPRELEEAAIMDGAGPFTILWRILLPLMMPAMVSTGLLAFIAAWNEFLFALTFTLSNEQRTVPVAIALISGGSQYELPWGNIMAASVIVTVPLVILVLVFQRRIISGLTAGALKG